jgi:hypothetical protein
MGCDIRFVIRLRLSYSKLVLLVHAAIFLHLSGPSCRAQPGITTGQILHHLFWDYEL